MYKRIWETHTSPLLTATAQDHDQKTPLKGRAKRGFLSEKSAFQLSCWSFFFQNHALVLQKNKSFETCFCQAQLEIDCKFTISSTQFNFRSTCFSWDCLLDPLELFGWYLLVMQTLSVELFSLFLTLHSRDFKSNDKNHELSTIVMYGFDFPRCCLSWKKSEFHKCWAGELQKSKTNPGKSPNGNHSVGGMTTRGCFKPVV